MNDTVAEDDNSPLNTTWLSANIVYAEAKERVQLQIQQIDSLDDKANFVLGSASLLTTGVASLRGALQESINAQSGVVEFLDCPISKSALVGIVTFAAFSIYAIVVLCAFQAYRIREFAVSPDPTVGAKILFKDHLTSPEVETKNLLSNSRIHDDLVKNEREIAKKVLWTDRSLRALLYESAMLPIMGVVLFLL